MIPARFRESPAFRKLFSKRLTIVAMVIISVYLLLFAWILMMEAVNWAGQKSGAFDISDSPVLGALLPERTLERVGASNEPGFGLESEPTKRMEQVTFYVRNVGKIFEEIDQGVQSDIEPRPIQEIYASAALAERRVADVPPDQLRATHAEAMRVLDRQTELRSLRDILPQITIALEKLADFRDAYQSTDPDTEAYEIAAEEVALTLDEVFALIDEYAELAPASDPILALDLDPLRDSMDAAFDFEPRDPIYDADLAASLKAATTNAGPSIDAAVAGTLADLEPIVDRLYPEPEGLRSVLYSIRMLLGTDQQGRSIMLRGLYSAKVAIQVGVVVSLIAVLFGSIIGAAAGYFGGIIDHTVIWLYSTFSSIPYLVLLVVLAFMFTGSIFEGTLIPLYVAFSLTYWIGPCRVIRGESLKLRSLDYVQAAQALGATRWRILSRHIIPNTSHLMFINMSLLFIGAIKGEVVLTFLGLGLKNGASWGIMINQSKSEVVSGFFWQIGAATFFMFVLVLAFNVLTDALQDAFDPKHVG